MENFGYILFSVVLSVISFWLASSQLKEGFEKKLRRQHLTKKQVRAKRRERTRNSCLLVIAFIVWLLSVIAALAGNERLFGLLLTAAAIVGIGYLVLFKDLDKWQDLAARFASIGLGLNLGFILGKLFGFQVGTYILGLIGAIALPAIIWLSGKWNDDDIDDDEDEEDAKPVKKGTRTVKKETPRRRRRVDREAEADVDEDEPDEDESEDEADDSDEEPEDDSEEELDSSKRWLSHRIIRELAKTEKGRQKLIEELIKNEVGVRIE